MAAAGSDEERGLHGNDRRTVMTTLAAMTAMATISAPGRLASKTVATTRDYVHLSPKAWPAREYARFVEVPRHRSDNRRVGRQEQCSHRRLWGVCCTRVGLEVQN